MEHLDDPADAATAAQWHFSHVVRSRGLLFCSGVMGTREDGSVDADPGTQLERAFVRLAETLATAGADVSHLVEMTSYHVGLQQHLATFAAVRDRHLAAPYPAWSAIGVVELAVPGALVEIRAVAEDPQDG
ncbi:RidA family protein [Nocardioides lentus]